MGKVIFLNPKAQKYHEERNIKIQNPPLLKLVKPTNKKLTLGQRIYRKTLDED